MVQDKAELLSTTDPDAIGLFRVSSSTTATVNERGEVTIRQTRKVAVTPPPLDPAMMDESTKVRVGVAIEQVVIKLPAADFALIGKMVGVILEK